MLKEKYVVLMHIIHLSRRILFYSRLHNTNSDIEMTDFLFVVAQYAGS